MEMGTMPHEAGRTRLGAETPVRALQVRIRGALQRAALAAYPDVMPYRADRERATIGSCV